MSTWFKIEKQKNRKIEKQKNRKKKKEKKKRKKKKEKKKRKKEKKRKKREKRNKKITFLVEVEKSIKYNKPAKMKISPQMIKIVGRMMLLGLKQSDIVGGLFKSSFIFYFLFFIFYFYFFFSFFN